jgi:hypothetical protein
MKTEVEIITNNQERPFLSWHELTEKEQNEVYKNEEGSFFRYRGNIYSLDEFSNRCPIDGWHGILNDTYFSGVLIAVDDEYGDFVKVGRFYS